jgi:hypothetical protein
MKKGIALILISSVWVATLGLAPVSAQDESFTVYFTEDMAFSTVLPDGWVADGNRDDGLTVANSADALGRALDEEGIFNPGDLALKVFALPEDQLGGTPVDEFLALVAEQVVASTSDDPPEFSEVEELDFAGRAAVSTMGISSDVGAGLIMYPFAPQTYAVAVIAATPDELDAMIETGLNALATVRYSLPLDATQDDELVTFNYPDGWVLQIESPLYMLANDQVAFDAEDPGEGQYKIVLADLSAFEVDVATLSLADATTTWVEGLLSEGQTASDPLTLTLDGVEVITEDVFNEDGDTVGGVFVVQFASLENTVWGVAFGAAPGDSYQISLTALNMLWGLQVAQQ